MVSHRVELGTTQEEKIVQRESGQMIQALQQSPRGEGFPTGESTRVGGHIWEVGLNF